MSEYFRVTSEKLFEMIFVCVSSTPHEVPEHHLRLVRGQIEMQ